MRPFIIAFVGLLSASLSAQKFSDLKLEATPERPLIVSGEPLTIAVRASNPLSQPIQAHTDLSPDYGYLSVEIAGPDGAFHRYLGLGWGKGTTGSRLDAFEPGKSRLSEVTLYQATRSESQDFFSKPGKHRIRITWASIGFEQSVQAPEIIIEVAKPSVEDGPILKAIEADPEIGRFIAGCEAPSQIPALASLADAHPKSVLAAHLNLGLGRHYFEARDFAQALKFLNRAAAAPPKSAVRRSAILLQIRAHMARKEEAEAKRLVQVSRAEFAGSVDEATYVRIAQELSEGTEKR